IDFMSRQVLREFELPVHDYSHLMAAKSDFAIFIGRSEDRQSLFCIDLARKSERWRIAMPNSVQESACVWDGSSALVFYKNVHGIIRPMRIDIENGRLTPDVNWQDPRSILAWHQSSNPLPEFVGANQNYVIGRWRGVEVICVQPNSGELSWKHS